MPTEKLRNGWNLTEDSSVRIRRCVWQSTTNVTDIGGSAYNENNVYFPGSTIDRFITSPLLMYIKTIRSAICGPNNDRGIVNSAKKGREIW